MNSTAIIGKTSGWAPIFDSLNNLSLDSLDGLSKNISLDNTPRNTPAATPSDTVTLSQNVKKPAASENIARQPVEPPEEADLAQLVADCLSPFDRAIKENPEQKALLSGLKDEVAARFNEELGLV